jgi:hypothetical protein
MNSMNAHHDLLVEPGEQSSFLRMDPDTGDIECFVPIEPDSSQVVSEADGAWRLVTPAELMQTWVLTEPLPLHYEEVGTEFDAEFERALVSRQRPAAH